ncbi:MAG: DUF4190 domain-containing protein [Oscillospiraceae bacterium]|nr:DUF4190 domain-containing protein [Oscillospiraceae bacterium]
MEEETKQNETKQENKKSAEGLSIASMVLGIVSVVSFMTVIIPIPCSILAIVFGIIGVKRRTSGKAIAGIALGSVGLVLAILITAGVLISIMSLVQYTNGLDLNSLDLNNLISNTTL